MKFILNIALLIVTALYPILVFLLIDQIDFKWLAVTMAFAILLRMVVFKANAGNVTSYVFCIAAVCLLLTAVFDFKPGLYWYPIIINLGLFLIFALSLWKKPTIIERFARLREPELPDFAIAYTEKVTKVWCLFFLINMSISIYTAVLADVTVWSLYNGLIAYLLMGTLMLGEWLVRIRVRKKHEQNNVI